MAKVMDEKEIAQNWLDDMSYTAAMRDYDAHMNLVSTKVQLHGVPGAGVIDYKGWARRRLHEFKSGLLFSLTYKNLDLRSADEKQITFTVRETMKSTEGHILVLHKEVMLEKEGKKNQWRVKLERINHHEMKSS